MPMGWTYTNSGVLVRIAGLFGISANLFLTLFESEEIMQQLEEEFDFCERIGASDFPGVYVSTAQGPEPLTTGFCQLDVLEQRLLQALEQI